MNFKNIFKNQKIRGFFEKISYFSARYFKWISVFLFLSVLVSGYILFLNPEYQKIKKVRIDTGEEDFLLLKKKQAELKKIRDFVDIYEDVNSRDRERIKYLLPDEDESNNIFTRMENIIFTNGFVLNNIKINEKEEKRSADELKDKGAVVENEAIKEVEVDLTISGADYEGFKTLLAEFENDLRITDINYLSFSPEGKAVSFSISLYFFAG